MGVARLVAADLDGAVLSGAPVSLNVENQGACGLKYPLATWWFDSTTATRPMPFKTPWRPQLRFTGPLGVGWPGVTVEANWATYTECLAARATTGVGGIAQLSFDLPNRWPFNEAWWVLSARALVGGIEVARLGATRDAPLPQIWVTSQQAQAPQEDCKWHGLLGGWLC